MLINRRVWLAAGGLLALFAYNGNAATNVCDSIAGKLASVEGQVTVQSTGQAGWQTVTLNQSLCKGDTVRTAERSRATVVLVNQAVLRIDQNTAMRLDNISGVTEAASSTGAAASQVLGAAGELSQQSEVLRAKVETFLAAVKAA